MPRIWVHITSGRGPVECGWVVHRVFQELLNESQARELKTDVLEMHPDQEKQTFQSILLMVEGDEAEVFLAGWLGTIQWVGQSPFRPHHKRKNWYIRVEMLKPPEQQMWSEKELRFETMRSSGPGGQHANKTNSAVRVTHLPSGLSAQAQEERSQHMNKKLALARLALLFEEQNEKNAKKLNNSLWHQHDELVRGNPVRVYKGKKFIQK